MCLVDHWSLHFFFFFFSSRRRHTRFDCDWSSDVCSSDLVAERMRAERQQWPHDLEDRNWLPPFLPAHSESELAKAMVNPLKVLTSGVERECRSEEHTSELQSQSNLVCRLLLEKKKKKNKVTSIKT